MRSTTYDTTSNAIFACLQNDPPDWDFLDALLSEFMILPTLSEQASLFCRELCAHLKAVNSRLLASVTPQHAHRLLNVFTSVANIQQKVDGNTSSTLRHYVNAIETGIRLSPPLSSGTTLTFRDIILASWFASFAFSTLPPSPEPNNILDAIQHRASTNHLPHFDDTSLTLVHAVHHASDGFINAMLDPTTGTLPNVVLFPDQAQMLSAVIFASPHTTSDVWAALYSGQSTYEIKTATSSALLTLARRIQEGALIADLGLDIPHCSNDALVLLLHYLALSLFPSASAFNDTGVVLCSMNSNAAPNPLRVASGRDVARLYYEKGLQIDPTHPHLLSNFGSLLKDAGHNTSAVGVFNHALQLHPELDIALVNMANTLKDMGRPADAVPYYLKAVTINPGLVDAYCGLSMSMNAVCNWTARDHWLTNAIAICEEHLSELHHQNIGILGERSVDDWLLTIALTTSRPQCDHSLRRWVHRFCLFTDTSDGRQPHLNEGSFLMRLIDWYRSRMQHRRYIETYGEILYGEELPHSPPEAASTARPFGFVLSSASLQKVPTVLPFHTFTLPLPSRTIRRIAHRNALRVSYNIMTQVSPDRVPLLPTPPLKRRLNVGYVSSDFSDHPLSHLMKSVFQLHDQNRFCVFLYATSPSDGSAFRQYFEQGNLNFLDVSSWSNVDIVNRIEEDHIHILVDLGGYTRGARNEIFAARPSPVQISLMGYAGTLAATWCDYLVCDIITCPVDLFARVQAYRKRSLNHCCQHSDFGVPVGEEGDPESSSPHWIFTECPIYMPHTYFVTDHKQSCRHGENLSVEERAHTPAEKLWNDEIECRADLRRALFPDLPLNAIIFANFNQLYKIDPIIFATWLHILARVPHSILWLLRFPAAGESHLIQTAKEWAGDEIASRIRFTDVAAKDHHIYRCRVPDLFLDTSECSAHTVAADVLWAGTPLIACAWPSHRHKMSSRVAASLASATGFGDYMVVSSRDEYEERAVALGNSIRYTVQPNGNVEICGDLLDLRRCLFLNRDTMPLFDTARWTKNLEKAFRMAWRRWVDGSMFRMSDDGCIWVKDDVDVPIRMN